MVSIPADGLAVLTLLVARIPIIQKLAILCSFWIISIFVSVVTMHPIILSFTPPPSEDTASQGILERFMAWMILVAVTWLFYLYGAVPVWPVQVLLGVAVLGLGVDLVLDRRLPGYASLGTAGSHRTDAFRRLFA